MKPGLKIGLGIFTSLATVGCILTYDFYIKERIDTTEVVVVKAGADIQKYDEITLDKLTVERRAKEALVDGTLLAKDINKVVGYDAKQDILGNSIVSDKMVDFIGMVPNKKKGEAIRPITKDMIFAKPGSLRRKDIIDIYLVNRDVMTTITQNGPSTVITQSSVPEVAKDILHNEVTNNMKPFLKDVRVVYVKDSGNKEVVSDAESQSPNDDGRLNATSTISDLEVILNEEDFSKLMDQVLENGAKLYITYR